MISWNWLAKLLADVWNFRTKVNQMSEAIVALKAEFASYVADVDAKVAAFGDAITKLEAQVADLSNDPAELTALINEVKTAHAALKPAVPAA